MIVKVPGHPGPPPVRPPWWPDFSGWVDCAHTQVEIRVFKHPKLTRPQYRRQCLTCGACRDNAIPEREIKVFAGLKPFDAELQKQWEAKRRAYFDRVKREHDERHARHNAEWWAWYTAYLQSPDWARLRSQVLARDGYKCNGCGGVATQAHHLHYRRVGYELLCDLMAVCEDCHGRLHTTEANTPPGGPAGASGRVDPVTR